MPSIGWGILRGVAGFGLAVASASPAVAQTCSYDITTDAVASAVTSIPSLSLLGLLLLSLAIGWLAWRSGGMSGPRPMAIALAATAALLASPDGRGLMDKAYAATVEILLSNPAGESVNVVASDGDDVLLRNTAGVPLRIASIVPTPAACADGTIIAPAATCSLPVSCPLLCGPNEVVDNGACVCAPGYVLQGGACVAPSCSINEVFDALAQPPGCVCAPGYVRNVGGICIPDI